MNGLADVDGFKICIQVYVWLGFPPLNLRQSTMYNSRHADNYAQETVKIKEG